MTLAVSQHPRGVGAWERGGGVDSAQLRRMHASHVLVMVERVDGRVEEDAAILRDCDAVRAAGAEPYLWAFHGKEALDEPEAAAERLTRLLRPAGAHGVVCNEERPAFGRGAALARLFRAIVDRIDERHSIGVGSYPLARFHPDFPWEACRIGYGLAETYQLAQHRTLVREALDDWRTWHPSRPGGEAFAQHPPRVVLPCPAAFETSSPGIGAEQLAADLPRICLDDRGVIDVPGVTVWSLEQIGRKEERVLAELAERFRDARAEDDTRPIGTQR